MTKSPHFSDSTIERRVREADVITRARAARPVQGGEDRLADLPGVRLDNSGRFGFPGN